MCSAPALWPVWPRSSPKSLPAVRGATRIGPCVAQVGNFIAVGLNYADHAAKSGMPVPKEPVLFNKARSCVVGPNDDVMIPKGSIRPTGKSSSPSSSARTELVSETQALSHVARFSSATTCRSTN